MLKDIDTFHLNHFEESRPTPEQWKARRDFYIGSEDENDENDDLYNTEKEHWFNDLRISVYFRNHKNVEEELDDIKAKLKKAVPGHDFDSFHLQTTHDDEQCIDGDIFTHEKAYRVSEIEKVQRKNKHTEKDVMDGKQRPGEDEE